MEQGIEGLPSVCGEIGQVAELAHGVDERGVTLEVVGVGLRRFCEGDVLVPLVAEAAVARVGVLGLVQGRDGARNGLEVEFGLLVVERGGVAAEGAFQLADAGMDVHPRLESVVEAGAVGLVVIDDGLPRREEALCGVAPFVVGGDVAELQSLGMGRVRLADAAGCGRARSGPDIP